MITLDQRQLFSFKTAEDRTIVKKGYGTGFFETQNGLYWLIFFNNVKKSTLHIFVTYLINWTKKKIIFHQDNTPAFKRVLEMAELNDLNYELLKHPPNLAFVESVFDRMKMLFRSWIIIFQSFFRSITEMV